MNKHLNEAIFGIGKVEALLRVIEDSCLDLEVEPEERERADRGVYLFYALKDEVHMVADELERLSGDCQVVDAIYAANDVQRKRTLTTED